jgi:hypothetical protein
LPKALWQAAVEMARQYGVYQTARKLRLDYTCLEKAPGWNAEAGKSHSFLRGAASRSAKPEECIIELETGSEMPIQWKANLPSDWSMLLGAWREASDDPDQRAPTRVLVALERGRWAEAH